MSAIGSFVSGVGSVVAPGLSGLISGIVGITGTAVKVASFASDPAGYITSLMQQAVQAMAEKVIPPMIDALHPDYTATWWLDSYRVSFAMAIFLAAILLIVGFVKRQRGKNSGREMAESVFVALPAFFISASFGPLLGILLTKVFTALEDSLALWAVDSTTKTYFSALGERAANQDAGALFGSALISQLTLMGLLLGLIVVVFVLLIQLATMYLTGALMALGIVWIVNPGTRHLAKVGPTIWLALCFSHSLLIFLVGVVFRAVSGLQVKATSDGSLSTPFITFVNLALPAMLILLVSFAPMALLRLGSFASAPLGGGGQARNGGLNPPTSTPQVKPSSGSKSGPSSPNDAANNSTSGSGKGGSWTPATQPATAGNVSMTMNGTGSSTGTAAASAAGKRASQQAATKGATAAAGKTAVTAGTAATGVGAPVAVGAMVANSAMKAAAFAARTGHQAAEHAGDAGSNQELA
jgi:hypothetical protein